MIDNDGTIVNRNGRKYIGVDVGGAMETNYSYDDIFNAVYGHDEEKISKIIASGDREAMLDKIIAIREKIYFDICDKIYEKETYKIKDGDVIDVTEDGKYVKTREEGYDDMKNILKAKVSDNVVCVTEIDNELYANTMKATTQGNGTPNVTPNTPNKKYIMGTSGLGNATPTQRLPIIPLVISNLYSSSKSLLNVSRQPETLDECYVDLIADINTYFQSLKNTIKMLSDRIYDIENCTTGITELDKYDEDVLGNLILNMPGSLYMNEGLETIKTRIRNIVLMKKILDNENKDGITVDD